MLLYLSTSETTFEKTIFLIAWKLPQFLVQVLQPMQTATVRSCYFKVLLTLPLIASGPKDSEKYAYTAITMLVFADFFKKKNTKFHGYLLVYMSPIQNELDTLF